MGFFAKLIIGHWRKHRLEVLLCLAGVALGVAVVVAIDAAVAASVHSFQGAVDSLAERSTHSIVSETTGGLNEAVYIELERRKLATPMAPVIERSVLISVDGGEAAMGRLLGVDAFSERKLRSVTKLQSSLNSEEFRRFMTEPGAVVLADELARKTGAKVGSTLTITIGGRRAEVHVVGIVKPSGVARSQLGDLILADLATAQELADCVGRIDRIDLSIDDEGTEKSIAASLPAGVELRSTRQRAQSLDQLIGSYRLNLYALSLMASFVAVFIVYNSMLISVQQRSESLATLRCLGASRGQLGGIYLAEAMLFAMVGGAAGVLGGWALSRELVGYVSTTINDLYAAVRPSQAELNGALWAKGMAVALGSCVVGAVAPLVRASRTAPMSAYRSTSQTRGSARLTVRLLWVGVALLAIAAGTYLLPGASPVAGFAMEFFAAMGFALACPWVVKVMAGAVARIGRGMQLLSVQMAGGGVGRSIGITGVAVAATMLAMAMNVGVRTMVSSFRGALTSWLDRRFEADIFIAPELMVQHKIQATLEPGVAQWVKQQPETRGVVGYRLTEALIDGRATALTATDMNQELHTFPIKGKTAAGPFDAGRDVLISEPLAGRMRLKVGDSIAIDSPSGVRRPRVWGVFYDFGNERGQVLMDGVAYAKAWRDTSVNSLHVTLAPMVAAGVERERLAGRWAQVLRARWPVAVNSLEGVKTETMRVFDRTFRITEVLTWLSGGVAFCGMAGSLLALALARRRDYSILSAVGMSGSQTAVWVVAQGLIIAWVSAIVAPVAGTVLAYILSYVIQFRSFGWSIPTSPQPRFWAQNLCIATAAAGVAAVYPILRLRQREMAGSLREE